MKVSKYENFLGEVFDDQRFASFYQTFCYKISWNYLKFWGRESEQSLILNLNPSPSEKNCVKSCIFCAKTNQFYSIFSEGGPQTPPLIHIFHSFLTLCWKKRRNKEVQTNSRIKNDLLNPITYPPPFFFFFCLLKFKVGCTDPPPPPSWKKILDRRLHAFHTIFQDWFSHGQRWPFISWVSADHYKLSFRLWQPAVAEWLSSWLAEQEDRGSIPDLATWIFRDWLSPASKSRYGWKIAKSTLILKTTNQTS